MKRLLASLALVFMLPFIATSQENVKRDPLLGHYVLANSAEVIHLTESRDSRPTLRHDLHDFLPNCQAGGPGSGGGDDGLGLSSDRRMDYVAADVNGDGKDELVVARAGASGTLALSLSYASKVSGLDWTWTTTEVLECPADTVMGSVRLVAANLDWTPRKELFLFFRKQGGYEVRIYDSLDALTHLPVKSESAWLWVDIRSWNEIQTYDMTAADFDRDGLDEVLMVSHEAGSTWHSLVFRLFDYDPGLKAIRAWPARGWGMDSVPWGNRLRLKITAGDFRNRGQVDAVVSATATYGTTGRQVYKYVTVLPSSEDYSLDPPFSFEDIPSGELYASGWETHAVAADLNPMRRDGDELVVAGPGELAVLKFDASRKPYYLAKVSLPQLGFYHQYEQRKFVDVADINADTAQSSWTPEIVLAEHHSSDSSTIFRVYGVSRNPKDSIVGLNQLYANAAGSPRSAVSELVMGDFDGDAIRTGPPKLIMKNAFLQPIVTLNIPPTHFDSLNGQVYDVCKAYGTNSSQFKAIYTQTQSQTSQFSSELGQSWGVSGKVGGSISAYGVKVKASIGASYGQGTYGSTSFDTTTTVSEELTSSADDWTLATVADYDLWEYPLYLNSTHNGDVLIQIPHFSMTKWLRSKDLLVLNWMADHEVGNLLSYPTPMSYQAWAGNDLLTSFSTMTVAHGAAMKWLLDLSTASVDESQFTKNLGVDVSASVSGWGMEAQVNGQYSKEDIVTHTSKATKYVTITVNVGPPDAAIPDASYGVRPFIYWARNGALTVDYAVDLDPGQPGFETFWGRNYSARPDPAFILPWRLDVEKGLGLNPNLKLFSKSLQVSPSTPKAGELVQVTARVHNFSLKDTDGPVKVRFYLGNPDSGGTPIVGTGGLTDLATPTQIPARDFRTVQMYWIAPSGLGNSSRIYAVIDPDKSVTEIHEENNMGFVPIREAGVTGLKDEIIPPLPIQFALEQNYPNPFNPTTVILYDLPKRSHVNLAVFDVLGRSVTTLVNGSEDAGHHHVIFDARDLATGIYFYRIQAENFLMTKKMIVVK